ncbi:GmrSD restriction endonuclease domain-containing protein [Aurantiacibacter rhizosphaerae]|uniref:DUF262 domain-containing protein n=1 Tax=Aurantiacibacter rhizosphaerae TaxID=2691582 RepID=A0A844XD94_9SPHN|nr:DUF262 domain-containing protein [Aurantiacibacter rhizosphaerae]
MTEIVNKMRSGDYFVDPSFQRRLVWNEKQKVRLIETVLMEYPMPEIYLWEQAPDPQSGSQKFSIVDGQQRLSTLREFTSNEWPLKKAYLDEENAEKDFADCFWKDLDADTRSKFFQYSINARRIPSEVSDDDIRQMFARLNETDRSLNPQEMRNATLNGEFLAAANSLADTDEFLALQIFSLDNIRRMGDVEFASQLLGYERKGIANDTPKTMNELYNEFNDDYSEAEIDKANVSKSLKLVNEVFLDEEIEAFFATQNYVYTLHSLFDVCEEKPADQWRAGLLGFVQAYAGLPANDDDVKEDQKSLAEFRKGASSRTRSKSSRTQRLFGLKNWLAQNFPELIEDKDS